LISKVFYGFEVKIFNSLKWAAKFTYASSLFSIASTKQGFVFSIFWYEEFGKAFQKKIAELVEFTLEQKKNSKIFTIISVQKDNKIVKKRQQNCFHNCKEIQHN